MTEKQVQPHAEAVEVVENGHKETYIKTEAEVSWWTAAKQSPKAVLYCSYMLFTCM